MLTTSIDPLSTLPAAAAGFPAFLVGRDRDGHWLAIEVHGQGGGLFVDRDAAVRYATSETSRRPGAVILANSDVVDPCDFKGFALI